ncbi:MAG: diguanylate cyclase [Pseudomonadota bacterium]
MNTRNTQQGGSGLPVKRVKEYAFAVNLMQHLVVPAFVLDPQCKVLIWNIACERLTGISGAEVIGTSDHWRGFYDTPRPCLADLVAQDRAADIHDLYAQHEKVEANNRRLYAENWCVMPQLGTRRYLAIDAGPIFDDAGALVAVVETLRDMTTQREAQNALEHLATRDGLTGIANRRTFDETLHTEWNRAARGRKPMSVLMVDVDHFKSYNDSFGHPQGDECLKRIAAVMAKSVLRSGELVARYGGEEFAVILPDVEARMAEQLGQRIRGSVEQLQIPGAHPDGPVVTVSIGAASTSVFAGATPAQLLAAADVALYQAKHLGRNCVVAIDRDSVAEAS